MAIASTQRTDTRLTSASTVIRRDWRTIVFRGVAALLVAAIAVVIGPTLLTPWVAADPPRPGYIPELHRWHDTYIGAYYCLLVAVVLAAAIPRPSQTPLLVQFLTLSFAILIVLALHPFILSILLVKLISSALLLASYPAFRALLAFPPNGRVSWPLLALAVSISAPLLLDAWTALRLQQVDVSEHATHGHWNGTAGIALSLALAVLLAATRRPGWRALGVASGVTLLYLGAAAMALPRHDGSWGETGGLLAVVGGVVFIATTLVESLWTTRPANVDLTES